MHILIMNGLLCAMLLMVAGFIFIPLFGTYIANRRPISSEASMDPYTEHLSSIKEATYEDPRRNTSDMEALNVWLNEHAHTCTRNVPGVIKYTDYFEGTTVKDPVQMCNDCAERWREFAGAEPCVPPDFEAAKAAFGKILTLPRPLHNEAA